MTELTRYERASDFDAKVYSKFKGKRSQCEFLAEYLDMYGSITPLEALTAFGCFRLSARIADLREDGYRIKTDINEDGKRYAVYRLQEDEDVQDND